MRDTRFSVRLDDLAETARRLATVEDHLAGATGRVLDVADCRAGDVAHGLEDFADHWRTGLRNLRGQLRDLHEALTSAHSSYDDHERAIVAALSGEAG